MSAMMAPLVIPIRSCETNCPGSLTAWTSSSTTSAMTIATARRDCQLEDLTPSIRAAPLGFASCVVAIRVPILEEHRFLSGEPSEKVPRSPAVHHEPQPTLGFFEGEDPVELELAVLDPVAGEFGEGSVAVLVEAPGTEHAIVVLGREQLPDHAFAGDLPVGVVGPLNGVEQHVGRLVAVGG